jgi:hypothetical protein
VEQMLTRADEEWHYIKINEAGWKEYLDLSSAAQGSALWASLFFM